MDNSQALSAIQQAVFNGSAGCVLAGWVLILSGNRGFVQTRSAEDVQVNRSRKGGKLLMTTHNVRILPGGVALECWDEPDRCGICGAQMHRNGVAPVVPRDVPLGGDCCKEALHDAYEALDAEDMKRQIENIISECESTGNRHFIWFARLLGGHLDGIATFADYKVTNSKLEGINQRTKTLRRNSYGLPDDEYFFLKLIDSSHKGDQAGGATQDLGMTQNIDTGAVEEQVNKETYYVICTNDTSRRWTMMELLSVYKRQSVIERNWRCLKDRRVLVSAMCLQKPSRICALMWVLSLALLVYAATEWLMRRAMAGRGLAIP